MKKLNKFRLIEITNKGIIHLEKPIKVYDLSVEKNHSYIANGNIVHNCTTSANVAVHYPMGSLIEECYLIKKEGDYETKIIADGGMRKYSDIIKALALGADIVMIGSLFNKTLQSCSTTYLWKTFQVSGDLEKWLFDNKFSLYKKFRGMSTKEVQKSWGKKKLTTSEGIVKWNEVLYDLPKWVENLQDYLKSAMSYTSSIDLEEFKECEKIVISASAYRRFNK